jgi:DNA-binding response OmpR family regulator
MLDRYVDNLVELRPISDQEPVEIGPIAIDLYRRSVRRDGVEVHLTPKEYAVLAELVKHRGRVLTHAQLLHSVWRSAQERQVEHLRVAVRTLRQKLEADPAHPAIIVNEPAVGFRLTGAA